MESFRHLGTKHVCAKLPGSECMSSNTSLDRGGVIACPDRGSCYKCIARVLCTQPTRARMQTIPSSLRCPPTYREATEEEENITWKTMAPISLYFQSTMKALILSCPNNLSQTIKGRLQTTTIADRRNSCLVYNLFRIQFVISAGRVSFFTERRKTRLAALGKQTFQGTACSSFPTLNESCSK